MTTSYFDGCEWNPTLNRGSWDNDKHYKTTKAELLVGANGDWRLCKSCSELKRFKRFRIRKPITKQLV